MQNYGNRLKEARKSRRLTQYRAVRLGTGRRANTGPGAAGPSPGKWTEGKAMLSGRTPALEFVRRTRMPL